MPAFLKFKQKRNRPMKPPKNDQKFYWTRHVLPKMLHYRISESLIRRIIRYPKRMEEGVALETMAAMIPAGSVKRPQEVWVMYAKSSNAKIKSHSSKIVVITAWRYPGTSPVRTQIPIPRDILSELDDVLKQIQRESSEI